MSSKKTEILVKEILNSNSVSEIEKLERKINSLLLENDKNDIIKYIFMWLKGINAQKKAVKMGLKLDDAEYDLIKVIDLYKIFADDKNPN